MEYYESRIRQCVYCGAQPLTIEHVLPKWLTRLEIFASVMNSQDEAAKKPHYLKKFSTDKEGRINGVGFVERGRRPRFNQIEVRAVCGPNCNRGWMSKLEVDVSPVLTRLMNGESAVVSREELGLIRRWACKTAMMFELNDKTTMSFTVQQYSEAYLKRGIIDAVSVGIARFNDLHNLRINHSGARISVGKSVIKYGTQATPIEHGRVGVTLIVLGKIALMVHNASDVGLLGTVIARTHFDRRIWTPMNLSDFPDEAIAMDLLPNLHVADHLEIERASLLSR